MIGAAVQLAISLFVPVGLAWYGRKKGWLSWKALGVGAVVFLVFSQVLEKALHIAVLEPGRPALKGTDSDEGTNGARGLQRAGRADGRFNQKAGERAIPFSRFFAVKHALLSW
ncbi:YhfC family glutamic-type intramembrane protease [Geobacillus stearothermophilus]|nr:YhfC family glutamic-type intramembrane protease [Geobacillus stearothermophilus]MED3778707.1 YhfC family glutamic-type intramembrane protease [Geobacillus stearothermophilus]MED3784848.1 YhfC family glutamic-type intramembrane protease [Geobacillus stearothermophilus]MED4333706.1 YhfC family glutamic-type intramembrane protease [Geobacillus stearothermophilus]MED4832220.1 YhfC family glutamic-type intramembrane protease [Geobacillus stearothermophilus]MED4871689.1 YhfC family glutamic-type